MCGRYVSPDDAAIEREFALARCDWQFPASYNVAPTQLVPVIRMCEGRRSGALLRWGLIPFFARGVPPRYSTINARMETVRTSAAYREPWSRGQRCLIPALGFYEWQLQSDGRTKVPYYIHLDDQEIFALAGLWERSPRAEGQMIESCVHLTMPANAVVGAIHNTQHRMPAILARDAREAWLRGSAEEAWSALEPYPDEHMIAWPVSTRVNAPANNDAALIAPLAAA